MSRMQSSRYISIPFLILSVCTTAIPGLVFAQANQEVIPKNASAKRYGSGWECELGYRANGKVCDAIKVPENAYMINSSYGDGWKCNWGFRKSNNNCVAIKIPANAYLNSYGSDWQCDRGFQPVNKTCVAVKVPKNGYFVASTFGSGWKCERGYKAKNDACVQLIIPVNAHIDYSGVDWDCNPPYIKQQNKCELTIKNY